MGDIETKQVDPREFGEGDVVGRRRIEPRGRGQRHLQVDIEAGNLRGDIRSRSLVDNQKVREAVERWPELGANLLLGEQVRSRGW